jgi:hypothetical protein
MPVWQDQNFSSIQPVLDGRFITAIEGHDLSGRREMCARSEWTRTAPAPLDPLERFDLG